MIDLFNQCLQLQTNLKDEYLLLMAEQEQKMNFQKKLQSSLKNYYRNFIHLSSTPKHKDENNDKILLENQGFGNCYTFIKEVMLSLAKNPQLCMILIKKHQNWDNNSEFLGIIKIIVGSMYENVVNDAIFEKDIIFLLGDVMQLIIQSKQHFYEYNFDDDNLPQLIIKEFTKKNDFMSYAREITRSTLLQIAKHDRLINFAEEDPSPIIKKIQSKRFDSPVKNKSQAKGSFSLDSHASKINSYSQALRIKDQKIRVTPNIRSKNRHCVSLELMRFLGINDEINFPSFFCATSENQIKEEEKINKQWAILLTKKQSSKKDGVNIPDIQLVKNLVFTFFGDLFKTLYSMPVQMRLLTKIMYDHLFTKYGNKKTSLSVIGEFVINFWIGSTLKFDQTLIQSGKIGDYIYTNSETILKIIKGIVKNDYKEINPIFQSHFNLMLSNLRLSILNYLCQLVNITMPSQKQPSKKIACYNVCLSVADVSKFLQMLKFCREQVNKVNEKVMKRVDRIYEMAEDQGVFGNKKDINTNKVYKSTQSFVLFTQLSLPPQLSFDYIKSYNQAFKNNKIKNLLKQVLLNISDLNNFDIPLNCRDLPSLFEEILKSDRQKLQLNAIDRVPINLKIKYLLALITGQQLEGMVDDLIKSTKQRLTLFEDISSKSKECYLKAISSVLNQNQKISYNQIHYLEEARINKLNQFINKAKIDVCLTSPKTREKEIVLRSDIMKDVSDEEKEKIWLENQSRCVHTAVNLEFIKSLTGSAQKVKVKFDSHISSIMKFPQTLCSLPEIKEYGLSGSESIGIKEVFHEFIRYCIELIKRKETDFLMLLENEGWLEQHLQQKLSKKIYDKLYPKMPTYDDLGAYFRLKTLDWITYEHLKIEPSMRIDGMWDIAARSIKNMQKMKTAGEKLSCIVQACKLIIECYSLICAKDNPVTPDDVYAIVVYVLIKAAPRRLISNIYFIELFSNHSQMMSQDGYFFTQLKSAIEYCSQLNFETLGADMGMVEFNKRIYEKQIEYGIYFLLGRKKDSPRTTFKKVQYLKEHYFSKKTH